MNRKIYIIIFLHNIMFTDSKMSSNVFDKLSLFYPDEIEARLTPVSNMPFDESLELRNSDCLLSEAMDKDEFNKLLVEQLTYIADDKTLPPIPPSKEYEEDLQNKKLIINGKNLGNGEMNYIQNEDDKLMMTNAWQAITQTNCWNFVSQDINSFMFSDDYRVSIISRKMEELGYGGHSGCSFGFTMRNMQYLAQNGEEEFKKLYSKKCSDIPSEFIKEKKFLEYSGGF